MVIQKEKDYSHNELESYANSINAEFEEFGNEHRIGKAIIIIYDPEMDIVVGVFVFTEYDRGNIYKCVYTELNQ